MVTIQLANTATDKCAAGNIAQNCSKDSHGICDGFHPIGSFTCTCNIGFSLNEKSVTCERKYCLRITFIANIDCITRLNQPVRPVRRNRDISLLSRRCRNAYIKIVSRDHSGFFIHQPLPNDGYTHETVYAFCIVSFTVRREV